MSNGFFTIELDWNGLSYDYPIHFLERIFDVWIDIVPQNHPFIEMQIDWEQETCTAHGLQEWVHPQKEEIEKVANEVIAKFKARCQAIDQKTKESPGLKNALYAAIFRGEDIGLDKI